MVLITRDPQEFAAQAQGFLAGRADCNVIATLLINALDGRYAHTSPLFACVRDEAGEVRVAAMRLPPWPLLCSECDGPAARELVTRWLEVDPQVSGVNGLTATARAICAAWAARTGGQTRLVLAQAMHECVSVSDPPRPAPGALRAAGARDRTLLVSWAQAFVDEAFPSHSGEAASMIDSRLDRGGVLVWEDAAPVCMVGVSPPVEAVVRVGPVYTPPAWRRRGYAGTAVAAVTRRAFHLGARRCMLYTDLSNPTSNKIYAEVGYRRFADWEEHEFVL